MNIALINGSPKLGVSNSGILLDKLEPLLKDGNTLTHYNISRKPLTPEQYREVCRMDAIVFAFPLYIDAIPSHLFRMLIELANYRKAACDREIMVYGVINNGFYEGCQNDVAADILRNWCRREGFTFGQAIGQGGGEMMDFVSNVPLGAGPLKNLGLAMTELAANINAKSGGSTRLFNPNLSHFSWKLTAHIFKWNASAKKNGLKPRELLARLS